eukprot:455863_1
MFNALGNGLYQTINLDIISRLLHYLESQQYDTDSALFDLENDHQSNIALFINDQVISDNVEDILRDFAEQCDDDDDEENPKYDMKCASFFDMDLSIYLYYLSVGKCSNEYFDENGHGKFSKYCVKARLYSIAEIEADFKKKRSKLSMFELKHFPLTTNANFENERKEEILKIIQNCWKNTRFYETSKDVNLYAPQCDDDYISNCSAIRNVADALKYQIDVNNNPELIYEYMTGNYNVLESDFHHILLKHLSETDKHTNNINFKRIHKKMRFKVQCKCNTTSDNNIVCDSFNRNNQINDEKQDTYQDMDF